MDEKQVKRDMWVFSVRNMVEQIVVFEKPVTADEAEILYGEDAYEDVIDENLIRTESFEVKL